MHVNAIKDAIKFATLFLRDEPPVPGMKYPLDRKACAQCTQKHISAAIALLRMPEMCKRVPVTEVYKSREAMGHVARAIVLAYETENGYPDFWDYVRGHLVLAEEAFLPLSVFGEPWSLFPEAVRKARLTEKHDATFLVNALHKGLKMSGHNVSIYEVRAIGHMLEASNELTGISARTIMLDTVAFWLMDGVIGRQKAVALLAFILRGIQAEFELHFTTLDAQVENVVRSEIDSKGESSCPVDLKERFGIFWRKV